MRASGLAGKVFIRIRPSRAKKKKEVALRKCISPPPPVCTLYVRDDVCVQKRLKEIRRLEETL